MMNVSYDFSGSSILVAGAASGIGRETALACARLGAHVWAADVDAEGLRSLPELDGLRIAVLDVADARACASMVERMASAEGRIDAAVLASAVQRRASIEEISDAQWQRHLDVNLSGVFYLMRAVMPVMRHQRCGSIVAFTSGLAASGWPGAAAYAATKAAIVGLVKCAALELRDTGVRVNALSPGLVATPVFLNSAGGAELADYERTVGVSRPEAVVPSLLHLIADGSSTISGTVVERRLIPSRPSRLEDPA